MKLSMIKHTLTDNLERNLSSNAKYFEYEYKVFYELESTVDEIGKCVVLHMNYTTITMTNHLLERLLKFALIHKSAQPGLKSIDQLNNIFNSPSQEYGSLSMANSIELCKKENLIDAEERDFLFQFVRETLRNGFSHGDAAKILSELSDEPKYYQANRANNAWFEMTFNPEIVPQLQTQHMESFANEHASSYFDYVFRLLQKIEIRLIDFVQNKARQWFPAIIPTEFKS